MTNIIYGFGDRHLAQMVLLSKLLKYLRKTEHYHSSLKQGLDPKFTQPAFETINKIDSDLLKNIYKEQFMALHDIITKRNISRIFIEGKEGIDIFLRRYKLYDYYTGDFVLLDEGSEYDEKLYINFTLDYVLKKETNVDALKILGEDREKKWSKIIHKKYKPNPLIFCGYHHLYYHHRFPYLGKLPDFLRNLGYIFHDLSPPLSDNLTTKMLDFNRDLIDVVERLKMLDFYIPTRKQ